MTSAVSSFLFIGLVTVLLVGTVTSGARREKKQRVPATTITTTTTTTAAAAEHGGGGGGTGGVAADEEQSLRPGFRRAPQNVSVSPGDKALLRCRVENLGAKTVTWRRSGDVHPLTIGQSTFVADSRVSVEYVQRVGEWNLIIRDIRPLDDGVYQCQINMKDDHNYHTVYLQVKAVQVRGTALVSRGDSIQLVCNATGRPDPPRNVEWYKDNRLIESDAGGGLIITKKVETAMLVSVLAIRRSRLSDAGHYFCRSSANEVGQIHVTVVNDSNSRRGTSSAEKITSGALAVNYRLTVSSVRSGLPYICCLLVSTTVGWNVRSVYRIRSAIVDILPT